MKVPFVDYPRQYHAIQSEIDEAIHRVLEAGDLILRHDVEEFEQKIAEITGVKHAVGVNSGTDALIFSLKAAGIREGDEVITVSHTFFATAEAIVHARATPVLVEVGEDYLMDPIAVEKAITSRTKAIMPVHLNGRVCDMEKIMELAEKYDLLVIEDAAQALGASFRGKKAGSFGLTGCFSFYPAKLLGAYGDAGAITTDSDEVAEELRLLRNHGQKTKTEIVLYGYTSRLDNLQAAVLNAKIKHLPAWIERRRELARQYSEGLSGIEGVKVAPEPDVDHEDVHQNYVIRVQKRDELAAFLKERGVETLIKDPVPLHWQPVLKDYGFSLPFSEQLAKEVISLPLFPELSDEEVAYTVEQVKEFYAK